MTKRDDLNRDFAKECVDCTKSAEASADCADCDLFNEYGAYVCADCDLNPGVCNECEMLSKRAQKTIAEVLVSSLTDKPVKLTYLDAEYDYPIEFTIKKETATSVSIDGWWDLGDTLYSPINDVSIDDLVFSIKDAIKRVDALLRMGAYVK